MASATEKKTNTAKAAAKETAKIEGTEKDRSYSQSELDAIVKAAVADAVSVAVAEAMASQAHKNESPTVIQVEQQEYVTLMFVGVMAKECEVSLGSFGKINRPFGTVDVPKKDFFQKRDFLVDKLLERKKLIVLSGLEKEDMERFGLVYKNGELLDHAVFSHILDFDAEKVCAIFTELCESHKRTVATEFISAYMDNDPRVTQEKVSALNAISKAVDEDGLFTSILAEMGRRLSE